MVPFSDYTIGSDFLFVKPMDNFDKKKEEDFPVQILTQSLMTFHDIQVQVLGFQILSGQYFHSFDQNMFLAICLCLGFFTQRY